MNTIKTIEQMVEALDNLLYWDNSKPEFDEARQAIQAGRALLEELNGQDPVAWADLTNSEMFGLCRDIQSGKHSAYDILWEVSTRLKARNRPQPAQPKAENFDHQKAASNGLREAMNRSQEIAKAAPQGSDK